MIKDILTTLDPMQRKLADGFITYTEIKLTVLELAQKHSLTARDVYNIWYNN